MRTTIDLDEDILQAAEEMAAVRQTTPGKIISELARQSLFSADGEALVRNGVPLLPRRSDEQSVTLDLVNLLRDQE